nr:MAG TPA: hypothetical protein [Caudoviricetes sp.]
MWTNGSKCIFNNKQNKQQKIYRRHIGKQKTCQGYTFEFVD